jgi:hypothetical protein
MEPDQPSLVETRTAKRLRLVRFYLPWLLAVDGHPSPDLWWQAAALQQLANAVLDHPDEMGKSLAGEYELLVLRLDRLRVRLWAQLCLPVDRRDLRQEAADWHVVQQLLHQTMPVVEDLLLAMLAAEELARARAEATPFVVRSEPGVAWLVEYRQG